MRDIHKVALAEMTVELSRIPLTVTRMVCLALYGLGGCDGWSVPFGSDEGAARRAGDVGAV